MLTAKENLLETIRGGKPDRFVNQYEAFHMLSHPFGMFGNGERPQPGQMNCKNAWGVISSWPAHTPAPYPEHTPDKVVVKDIECWQDYVHAPSLKFTDEQWGIAKELYDAVDSSKAFRTAMIHPGLFEQSHYLCSMTEALVNYMAYPDEMHDLIRYLTDFELELAEGICSHLHPDAIHHHDDWGSEASTFLSPEMFADFFLEPYKEIYRYYHEHGVQVIVHHSDSYAATLVPSMIEMGIDIWQGPMRSNDIGALLEKYGGQISFMAGIDNKQVDFEGWTREDCRIAAEKACDEFGRDMKYYIPCISQGLPGSIYPGVYEMLTEEIDKINAARFGITDPESARLPVQRF